MNELLTNDQMRRADRMVIGSGTPGIELMRRAGRAVAEAAIDLFGISRDLKIVIVCGPGNNGGDGFIAARELAEAGMQVFVTLLGDRARMTGDARLAAELYPGEAFSFSAERLQGASGIIDALFGSGLARDIGNEARSIVEAVNASGLPVLAIDVPSGLDGDSGLIRGAAVRATRTVTFFRRKPGHFLTPGRNLCGRVDCVDIGISASVLDAMEPDCFLNDAALWRSSLPVPTLDGHKYRRGHAAVVSGGLYATGAARLAARAALRVGAGLVSVVSPLDAAAVNAAQLTSVMLKVFGDAEEFVAAFSDRRINVALLGPGAGVGAETRARTLALLAGERDVVLDADALTSFEALPDLLSVAIGARQHATVLTPHDGEFARLFLTYEGTGDRLAKARHAAAESGAVVVMKGPDTVIAEPSGRACINASGSRWLATAGSGDVLAGMIAGLLAQGMPAFEAASAAVYLHGCAGRRIGAGLIAEDIPEQLPTLLAEILPSAGDML